MRPLPEQYLAGYLQRGCSLFRLRDHAHWILSCCRASCTATPRSRSVSSLTHLSWTAGASARCPGQCAWPCGSTSPTWHSQVRAHLPAGMVPCNHRLQLLRSAIARVQRRPSVVLAGVMRHNGHSFLPKELLIIGPPLPCPGVCDSDVEKICGLGGNGTSQRGLWNIGVVGRCLSRQLAEQKPIGEQCRSLVAVAAPQVSRLYSPHAVLSS